MPNEEGVSTDPYNQTPLQSGIFFVLIFGFAFGILVLNKCIGDAPSPLNFMTFNKEQKEFVGIGEQEGDHRTTFPTWLPNS